MNPTFNTLLLTAALAATFSPAALASVQAISCDGCSERTMQRSAAATGQHGLVYVFNAEDRKVNKYQLVTEGLDFPSNTWEISPYATYTTALKVKTESALKGGWVEYLDALDDFGAVGDGEPITMPDDFPIRSVAGALIDPAFTTTAIEDHLLTLSEQYQVALTLNTLVSKALDLKLPLVDLRSIIQETTVTIEFPDGSTMDFSLYITADQMSLAARTELNPEGNARTADGQPAPTSGLGFRGRRFDNDDGALIEWIELARSYGLRVDGRGTRMECVIDGSAIRCIVTRR